MMKALGEMVSGGQEEQGQWVLILLSDMSFKGKTASEETEPCPRLYKTIEQTSRPWRKIRRNYSYSTGLKSEDIEVILEFESQGVYDLLQIIKPQLFYSVKWGTNPDLIGV